MFKFNNRFPELLNQYWVCLYFVCESCNYEYDDKMLMIFDIFETFCDTFGMFLYSLQTEKPQSVNLINNYQAFPKCLILLLA